MEKEISQNQTSKKKKFLFWLPIFVIIGLLCLVALIYFLTKPPTKPREIPSEQPKEKTLEEKQLEELDALRQYFGTEPFTEKEIQKQLEELEKLRSQ